MKHPQKKITLIFLIVIHATLICLSIGSAEPKKIIRMGHIADSVSGVDINDAKIALNVLLDRVLKKILPEYTYENFLFMNTESAVKKFNAGKIEILSLTSINYLKIRDLINMNPAFVAVSGENPENRYVLLIQKKPV